MRSSNAPEAFRFSNWLGTGQVAVGMTGVPNSMGVTFHLQSSYLATQGGPDPVDVSLEEAWNSEEGLLLLLGAVPASWDTLATAVRARCPAAPSKVVWVPNGDAPGDEWKIVFLRTRREGERLIVEEPVFLPLTGAGEGYGFGIAKGVVVERFSEGAGVTFSPSPDEGGRVTFGRAGAQMALDGPLSVAFTPAGGLSFDGVLEMPGGTEQATGFDALDIGLRYAFQDVHGDVSSIRFPLVAPTPGAAAFRLRVTVASGRLTDPEATRLEASEMDDVALVSGFRTLAGRPILLRPRTMAFVFGRRCDAEVDDLTLMPAGTFDLSVGTARALLSEPVGGATENVAAETADAPQFACGVAGTESILLPEAEAGIPVATLDFVPDCPAFWPGTAVGEGAAKSRAALTDRVTTSWLRVYLAEHTLDYRSQPPGDGAMYRPDSAPDEGGGVPLLDYYPVRAGRLVAPSEKECVAFPMVPFALLSENDFAAARRVEAAAVAPTRKALIPSPIEPEGDAADGVDFSCVTPRGLECVFTEVDPADPSVWKAVRLAHLDGTEVAGTSAGAITLEDIRNPLESALLASQQCLVVSEASSMAAHLRDAATVNLSGWGFSVAPDAEHWDRYGTIMIVKNADLPLEQMLLDVGSWTQASDFNRDPGRTRERLRTIIDEAVGRYERDVEVRRADPEPPAGEQSELEYFVETVLRSPKWNGHLFLNVAVAVPDTLGGLRAGIDEDRFFAHHIGVTQRVFKSMEALGTTSSAIFGLVSYADASEGFGGGDRYAFRVSELGLSFRNSVLAHFRATLDVWLGTLFGKRPAAGDDMLLRLDGLRQRRGGHDTYMFSLRTPRGVTFETGPLKSVHIGQAEFETRPIDPEAGTVSSRFSFVGAMQLAALEDGANFDVLSFDSLGFSDLRLEMSFHEERPHDLTFDFRVDAMKLEAGRSEARPGSLFAGFPVRLGEVISGGDEAPGEQGFVTVRQEQQPGIVPLDSGWYGVSLVLDMGTLTEVAASVGFEANLLTAWGPRDDQVFLGLRLPGTTGGRPELSVLGVLKVTPYSLSMRRDDEVWALMMNGVRLGVFGKKMPSGGSFDFYLFGNPDPGAGESNLGWYGAYRRDVQETRERNALRGPEAREVPARSMPDQRSGNDNRFPLPVPRGGRGAGLNERS